MKCWLSLALAATLLAPLAAAAQAWTAAKPIRIEIPFPAGGATDSTGPALNQERP